MVRRTWPCQLQSEAVRMKAKGHWNTCGFIWLEPMQLEVQVMDALERGPRGSAGWGAHPLLLGIRLLEWLQLEGAALASFSPSLSIWAALTKMPQTGSIHNKSLNLTLLEVGSLGQCDIMVGS